jgi:hypothetical protein
MRVRFFKPADTWNGLIYKIDHPSSSSHRQPPAAATVARRESFAAAARRATVGSGILSALVDGSKRAQSQPQFAHLFFVRSLRALLVAPQPGPVKRHIGCLPDGYKPELLEASASELFLQLSAFHKRYTAPLHGARDHAGRISPVLRGSSLIGTPPLPDFSFSNYARHCRNFLSLIMRKIFEITINKVEVRVAW